MILTEEIQNKIEAIRHLTDDYEALVRDMDAEPETAAKDPEAAAQEADKLKNKQEQLRRKTQKACKSLTDSLNIPELLQTNRDIFCGPLEKKLEHYFLTRKQKLFAARLQYGDKYYGGLLASRVRISADNFEQFIESFLDPSGNLEESVFYEAAGKKNMGKYLLDTMKKHWPEETGEILDSLKQADRLMNLGVEEFFLARLRNKKIKNLLKGYVCSTFNGQKIENLLAKNQNYRKLYKIYKEAKLRALRIRQGLLDNIPKTYPELFPLARQKQRSFILHVGPTNSGKSYEAVEALKQAETGIYLAPLRLLAYEKYEELNEAGCYCSLKTGEEEIIVPGAALQSSTIEILDFSKEYEVAVIDEAQMAADSQRGSGWTFALLGVNADVVHVCLAPEAETVVKDIIRACGDNFEVRRHERLVPLTFESSKKQLYPGGVQTGDALIVFSRRDVHAVAAELQHKGHRCSVIYGNLPYDVRRNEVRRYQNGETDLVVATDAIGMGVNLPIRRIVFLELDKFDGKERRDLTPQEIKQIAGRAGRYGIFDKGLVTANEGAGMVRAALKTQLPQIKKARIGFPYTLLGIEGKASELMEKWCEIRPKPGFEVADLSREIELARELEAECEDKQLVYDFVMFPFDEKSSVLKDIWLDLFQTEHMEAEQDFMKYLPTLPSQNDDLSSLELDFKICDLLYHYADKFTDRTRQPDILQRKNEISSVIIKKLEKEKLERRRCRRCGKPMPFLYPHSICKKCHDHIGRKRSRAGQPANLYRNS